MRLVSIVIDFASPGHSLVVRKRAELTQEILRASGVVLFFFFALLCCCFVVSRGRGVDAGAVLDEELNHRRVVARGGAVQRSPAVVVGEVDVAAELDEKLHAVEVRRADGVVQGGQSFVIRLAGIVHFFRRFDHQRQFADHRRVEKKSQRIEHHAPSEILRGQRSLEQRLQIERGVVHRGADGSDR